MPTETDHLPLEGAALEREIARRNRQHDHRRRACAAITASLVLVLAGAVLGLAR